MIELLEQTKWGIIKEINIVSKNQYGEEITIGFIIYKRNITDDYKLNDDPEQDPIKRLLDYPKQSLFSVDELDELILSSVQRKFPKSFVRNYQVVFDSDQRQYDYILKRHFEKAALEVRPDFSNLNIFNTTKKTFPGFYREINIYQDFTQKSIQSIFLTANCNFERSEEIINKLKQIEFL